MQLVFIHGWGFDARFWDALAPLLTDHDQYRVDLGFYGNLSEIPVTDKPAVLIGHSLGFVRGITQKKHWHRWIAINSFSRFVRGELKPGCTSAAELRELKIGLSRDPAKALQSFYDMIEVHAPEGIPHSERLRAGLDELRDVDLERTLETLEIPGLVLAARNDPLVPPKTSEWFCGLVRQGGIRWHENGGHVLPLRDPEWCARAIESFLA